jgi:hypothetical protein
LLFLRYKSQKQLSEELGKDPKTIEYHLRQLIKLDIIEEIELENGFFQSRYKNGKKIDFARKNCEKIFQLKDPYQFFDILIKYKKKLLDMGNTENFIDVLNWFFDSYPKDIDFGNKSNRKLEDDFVNTIYSIFPMFFRA